MWLQHLRTPNSKWVPPNEHGMVSYNSFSQCSIGVVQRLASEKNYETLQEIKQLGMKVIYDLDDDMWAVQASNPAKSHLKQFEDYRRGFIDCSRLCDIITVSTTQLRSSVTMQVGSKISIEVIGNAVDLALLRPSFLPKKENKIVIGWAGSNTHIADLAEMGSTLDWVLDNCPKAHLHWIGMLPPGKNTQMHPRVYVHGWVHPKEYPVRLSTWNWNIGVAPLEDNRFNRSKSAIKMMELGALKIPCLCSPVRPYLEFTSLDKRLEWLLCNNEREWIKKLNTLINEKEQREYYGNLMYDVVKENYNMEKRIKVWQTIFRSLA